MQQLPTLRQFEYMEAGFEVSKILVQAGYDMDKPAFSITWGQITEEVAHTLADHGLPVDRLEEDKILDLVVESADVMKNEDVLFWRESVRVIIQEYIGDLCLENNQN
ncbi:MAG: hypothetical protein JEZ00_11350 [Anaerolineaceae bacterium]|nr:hypothetical protein [Anaerolineaceae bacterium]